MYLKKNLISKYNDPKTWKEFVMEKHGIDKSAILRQKFSIDGGPPKNARRLTNTLRTLHESKLVKMILDRLGIGSIKLEYCIASDYKQVNIIVGIQEHSLICPYPYCEWKKRDQFNEKWQDKIFGVIR